MARKKINFLRLIAFMCFCCPAIALAGQEGHGGDSIALEVTKIGQALRTLFIAHPEWEVSRILSAEDLSWSINNSFVQSGNFQVVGVGTPVSLIPEVRFSPKQLDSYDNRGNIFINRTEWRRLNCAAKIRETLHLYLSVFKYSILFGKRFDDTNYKISTRLPQNLATTPSCSEFLKEKGLTPPENFSEFTDLEQIKILRKYAVEYLDRHPDWIGSMALTPNRVTTLKNILRSHKVVVSKTSTGPDSSGFSPRWLQDKDVVTFFKDLQYDQDREYRFLLPNQLSYTRDREIEFASMFLYDEREISDIRIWLNSSSWSNFTFQEKFEILFHEFFSVLTTFDLYYRISSTIFLQPY